jgi:hypothetical protein
MSCASPFVPINRRPDQRIAEARMGRPNQLSLADLTQAGFLRGTTDADGSLEGQPPVSRVSHLCA